MAFGVMFAAGTMDGLVAGASFGEALKAGLISGVAAAAFTGVGQYFQGLSAEYCAPGLYQFGGNTLTMGQIIGQVSAHAALGGVMSALQGGKFGHGFVSAGVTKGVLGALGGGGFVERLALHAVVGGTVSDATGGKFANGAKTAAFQFLFNEMSGEAAKSAQKNYWGKIAKASKMESERIAAMSPKAFAEEFGTYYGLDIDKSELLYDVKLGVAKMGLVTDLMAVNANALQQVMDPAAGLPNEYGVAGTTAGDLGRPILGKFLGILGDYMSIKPTLERIPPESFIYSVDYGCAGYRCKSNDIWVSE